MTPAKTLGSQLSELVIEYPGHEIPGEVIELAKFCLIDAVGCAIHGRSMPWTKVLERHLSRIAKGGECRLFDGDLGFDGQHAAMLWGASCHAFELDNLRRPGAGVHPGACIAMPALAMAIENENSGRELLESIALAIEGMFRIGLAARHSSEKLGFHAPGITGPFGAALACARLLGLSANQAALALGICGSFAGGLLEFSQSNQGGMVKRIHMGRAAEAGFLAARLAEQGYEGPLSILEGTFGVLNVFCKTNDPSEILREFGSRWESRTMCFKKFPSHITTQAILEFLQVHGFPDAGLAQSIARLLLYVPPKVITHHATIAPVDLMGAQYSVPFMAAAACFVDVSDPRNINDSLLSRPEIFALAEKVVLVEAVESHAESWDARIEMHFLSGIPPKTGEQFGFPGSPTHRLSTIELQSKFNRLVTGSGLLEHQIAQLFNYLMFIEGKEVVSI